MIYSSRTSTEMVTCSHWQWILFRNEDLSYINSYCHETTKKTREPEEMWDEIFWLHWELREN